MTDATLKNTADDVAESVKKAGKGDASELNDAAERIKRSVTDQAGAAKDWAGERAGVAKDWALDQTDVIRDTVQTRPFISVGVSAASAFAAGLVLGVLLTRR